MARKQAPGSTAKEVSVEELHGIKVGQQLIQNVEGHPPRSDSKGFVESRELSHKIIAESKENIYGPGPFEAHHGGSLPIFDPILKTWYFFTNGLGIEWNQQFACDAKKVDALRQRVKFLYDRFQDTLEEMKRLGFPNAEEILNAPIIDGEGISRWVDSPFNAILPLPKTVHTGTVTDKTPDNCGIHNYPDPAWHLPFLARPGFKCFVPIDSKGTVAHVAPSSHDQNDKRVRVLSVHGDYRHGHPLHKKHVAAETNGRAIVLDEHDPISMAAYGVA